MTTTALPATRQVVLDGISWKMYQDLRAEVGDSHVRLTFDRGRLQIMSPSPIHENVKTVLARLIEAYADAMEIPVEGLGSTTFDREDLQKGLEPDECYYIANAAAVIGKEELDLTIDPPPDLAIEIDISHPDVKREPIYAALGVPEIWMFDGRQVVILIRGSAPNESGEPEYAEAEQSLAFANWKSADINRFLQIGLQRGQTTAVRSLREWCANARQ